MLATHPGEGGKLPVLAVQPGWQGPRGGLHRRHNPELAASAQGDGPGIALPAVLGPDDPLAGQPITADVKAEAGIAARTDKAYYEPDSPINILAAVRDKEGEGTDQAEVVAQVKTPAGNDRLRDLVAGCWLGGQLPGELRAEAASGRTRSGRGQARRDGTQGRAGDGRGRQAQPRVRPARPRRRDAVPDRRGDRRALFPHQHRRPVDR